jgi:hypothetical protein
MEEGGAVRAWVAWEGGGAERERERERQAQEKERREG